MSVYQYLGEILGRILIKGYFTLYKLMLLYVPGPDWNLVYVGRVHGGDAYAAEKLEVTNYFRSALGSRKLRLKAFPECFRMIFVQERLRIAQDVGKRAVSFVGHSSGEFLDRRQTSSLSKPFVYVLLLIFQ